ncbi:hypothetical protein DTL21_09500 [Bremerella cremea]|nr:hypothetical protein DTL21_09500 [Bremerella cremea]
MVHCLAAGVFVGCAVFRCDRRSDCRQSDKDLPVCHAHVGDDGPDQFLRHGRSRAIGRRVHVTIVRRGRTGDDIGWKPVKNP